MSRSIDERIVEMKFNNKDFEKNAAQTMSTLDKLKQKLNFSGATKGIDEINKAAGKFSLGGMEDAASGIEVKFNAMSVVAITAIQNIVNKATDAGLQLAKSLSIDQITAGWDKFGKKTTSVGTLVSQGYSIEEVNKQLDRLMWFTDETSYNYTDMVDSITKFTASGKGLGESVDAMEGIALWAAMSGQNASTASRAMYQLSQAIGRSMTKQDWVSVMNANMDTAEFRQKALDAAVALGTLRKVGNDTYQSLMIKEGKTFSSSQFIDHLTEDAWFTSDVMMKVYKDYASAVSDIYGYTEKNGVLASEAIKELAGETDAFGLKAFRAAQETRTFADALDATKDAVSSKWLKTFELFIGDYQEATKFWSDFVEGLYDVFASPIDDRNEVLFGGLASGWKQFAAELGLDAAVLADKVKVTAKEHGISIDEMIQDAGNLAETFKDEWLTADILTEAIQKLIVETDGYSDAELEAIGYTREQVDRFKEFIAGANNGSIAVDEWINKINQMSGRENLIASFWNVWDGAINTIGVFKQAIAEVFPGTTSEGIYNFTVRLKEITEQFQLSADAAEGLKNIVKGFLTPLQWIWSLIKVIAKLVGSVFSTLFGWLNSFLEKFKDVKSIGNLIEKIFGSKRYTRLTAAWNAITLKLASAFEKVNAALKNSGVSEKIQNAWEAIKAALEPIADWILDRIVDGFAWLASVDWSSVAESVIEWVTTAYKTVSEWVGNLSGVFSTVAESIRQFFGNIDLSSVWSTFAGVWESIKGFFTNLGIDDTTESIAKLKSEISTFSEDTQILSLGERIKALWDTVSPYLANIGNTITDLAAKIDIGKIAALAFSVAAIRLIWSLSNVLNAVTKLAGGLSSITKSISGFFDALTNRVKTAGKPNYIRDFAIAIGVLAGSLLVLSFVPKDKLEHAAIILGIAATVFTGLVAAIMALDKKLSSAEKISNTIAVLLSLAASILALAISLKMIASIQEEGIWEKLGAFGILLGGFALSIIALTKFAPEMSKGTIAMVFAALSLLTLTRVLKAITQLNIGTIIDALPSVMVMLGIMFVLGKMMTEKSVFSNVSEIGADSSVIASTRKTKGKSFGAAAGMLVMVVSLLILTKVLKKLAEEPISVLIKGLLACIPLFAAMTVLAVSARLAGKNSASAGIGLLAASAGIWILAKAIKNIGELKKETIEQGTASIVAILGMFAVITALSGFGNTGKGEKNNMVKVGASLILMAAAIEVLAIAIRLIGAMDLQSAITGTAAVVVILSIFTVIITQAKHVNKSAVGVIALLALVIAEVVAAIAILSSFDNWANVVASAAALSLVLLSFGAAMRLMATDSTQFVGQAGSVLVGLGALLVIVDILNRFLNDTQGISWQQLIASAAALSLVLVSLAASTFVLAQIKDTNHLAKAEGLFALLIGIVGLITGFLGFLEEVTNGKVSEWLDNGIQILEKFASPELAAVFGGFAVLLAALSGIAAIPIDASQLAAVEGCFGILILIVGLLATLFSTVEEALGEGFFERGFKILEDLGKTLGYFFGNFIGGVFAGITETVTNALPNIGDNISLFVDKLCDIAEKFNTIEIDSDTVTSIGGLAQAILTFTEASFLDGIAGLLRSNLSLENVGEQLLAFAPYLSQFSDALTGHNFDAELVSKAAEAAKAIGEFVNIVPREGGLINKIIGEAGDMTAFGDGIVSIADAMIQFDTKIKEYMNSSEDPFNQETIDVVIGMGKELAGLQAAIPETGGILQQFLGEHDFKKFGKNIVGFAGAMIDYDTAIQEYLHGENGVGAFDKTAIEATINMGKQLAELNNVIPTSNGYWQKFIGDHDFTKFSEEIVGFAGAMIDYDSTIQEYLHGKNGAGAFNKTAIAATINMGKQLAELYEILPKSGGVLSFFTGSTIDMSAFSSGITDLGVGLGSYYDEIKDIKNPEVFKASAEALKNFVTAWNAIEIDDGVVQTVENTGLDILSSVFGVDKDITDAAKDHRNKFKIIGMSFSSLAETIVPFYEQVKDLNWEKIKMAGESLSYFSISLVAASDIDPNAVDRLVSSLKTVATISVDEYSAALQQGKGTVQMQSEDTFIDSITSAVNDTAVATDIKQAGEDVYGYIIEGYQDAGDKSSKEFGSYFVDNMTDALSKSTVVNMLKDTGGNLVSYLFDGISQKAETDSTGLSKNIVQGLYNGLLSKDQLSSLGSAGRQIAHTVKKATEYELDINSPSGEYEEIGRYTIIGFANGLIEYLYLAKQAASQVGEESIDAMSMAVSYAYAAAVSDYDFQPTISPVLDLSNVKSEAGRLGSMLASGPTIKMAAENERMITARVTQAQIDNVSLNDAVSELRGDIYRMRVRLADGNQSLYPDLEGAIERGFSHVSVNMDGRKVGRMNVNYQNQQAVVRGSSQVKR